MKKYLFLFVLISFSMTSFAQHLDLPNYHTDELEVVADLGKYQAIGLSVSSKNRIFVSFPRRGEPCKNGLVELVNGKQIPFPDEAWNKNKSGEKSFFSIQDLYVD